MALNTSHQGVRMNHNEEWWNCVTRGIRSAANGPYISFITKREVLYVIDNQIFEITDPRIKRFLLIQAIKALPDN
jgi:hypothetical protein